MQGIPTPGSVGAKIAEARGDAGLSWEALAAALGVSLDTLKRYERGDTDNGPSYLTVVTVAKLTNRPLDWFMTIDPEPVEEAVEAVA
jgi:transcriptional regulator with XRE-family HTH domain